MKKIEAIIRSSKFEEVKEALSVKDINFFTFYEGKGYVALFTIRALLAA